MAPTGDAILRSLRSPPPTRRPGLSWLALVMVFISRTTTAEHSATRCWVNTISPFAPLRSTHAPRERSTLEPLVDSFDHSTVERPGNSAAEACPSTPAQVPSVSTNSIRTSSSSQTTCGTASTFPKIAAPTGRDWKWDCCRAPSSDRSLAIPSMRTAFTLELSPVVSTS